MTGPITITVPTRRQGQPLDVPVTGWPTATPGLAVTRPVGVEAERWMITHIPTGYHLGLGAWPCPEAAMEAAAALGPLWDWTRCEPAPRQVADATREILEARQPIPLEIARYAGPDDDTRRRRNPEETGDAT